MKEVKPSGDIEQQVESEFKLVGDEEFDKEEDLFKKHPSKYYEFAQKEGTWGFVPTLFRWMQKSEIDLREAAGIKFAIFAAIIFGVIGGVKVEYFYHVSFMNYIFLQMLVSLGIFYLYCRQMDILPFLEDEALQTRLKVSAVANLAAFILYVASWNYWPRQYSHIILCAIPLVENLREGMKHAFNNQDLILLGVNFLGQFILLTIPDRELSFSLKGLVFAVLGVALFWIAFQQLKALGSSSNLVSIGLIQTLVSSIFLPGFFGVVTATPPTILELLIILIMGIFFAVGLLLLIRTVQITKPSHCLITASVALALISWVRSVNSDGFLIQGLLGVVLAVGCAIYILYHQQNKTVIMSYMAREPLIN
jgi:hypothetical protein